MTYQYQGHYPYHDKTISDWPTSAGGVYYCGYVNAQNVLVVHYIGRSIGENGIRGRLLDHLRDNYWPDVTHFGYSVCTTAAEAINLEAAEIKRLQPKYNTLGL